MRPHRQQSSRLPHPWDSPGKNSGVGCHFLLQCMKVKSESEVAQSCLDSSWSHGLQPTRPLHPWDFPGKSTEWGYLQNPHWDLGLQHMNFEWTHLELLSLHSLTKCLAHTTFTSLEIWLPQWNKAFYSGPEKCSHAFDTPHPSPHRQREKTQEGFFCSFLFFISQRNIFQGIISDLNSSFISKILWFTLPK